MDSGFRYVGMTILSELVAVFVVGEAEFVDGALRVDGVSGCCDLDAVAVGVVDEEVALTVGSFAGARGYFDTSLFDRCQSRIDVIYLEGDVPPSGGSIPGLDEVQHAAIFGARPDERVAFDLVRDDCEPDQIAKKSDRRRAIVGREPDVVDFFDFETTHLGTVFQLDYEFDFDCDAVWQAAHTYSGSGVFAVFAEDFDHQVGEAVDYGWVAV